MGLTYGKDVLNERNSWGFFCICNLCGSFYAHASRVHTWETRPLHGGSIFVSQIIKDVYIIMYMCV